MPKENVQKIIERFLNIFELTVIILVLFLAFAFQIILKELPCPLCLLQRVGFLGIALGFLMNLRFGLRPSHYSIVIVSGLFTCLVALRQISLHVVPGTGVYGSAILGFHLYTWSFIIAAGIILFTALDLGFDRPEQINNHYLLRWPFITHILFATVTLLIVLNITAVLLECGVKQCPDNPVRYEFELR